MVVHLGGVRWSRCNDTTKSHINAMHIDVAMPCRCIGARYAADIFGKIDINFLLSSGRDISSGDPSCRSWTVPILWRHALPLLGAKRKLMRLTLSSEDFLLGLFNNLSRPDVFLLPEALLQRPHELIWQLNVTRTFTKLHKQVCAFHLEYKVSPVITRSSPKYIRNLLKQIRRPNCIIVKMGPR